jgi:5-bromo-4-chloroindolyl phosphate hydrolysis protein
MGISAMEATMVQMRTHQKNIDRYKDLLETELSEVDRQYIEKRLSEERLTIATLQFTTAQNGYDLRDAPEI